MFESKSTAVKSERMFEQPPRALSQGYIAKFLVIKMIHGAHFLVCEGGQAALSKVSRSFGGQGVWQVP